MKRLKRMIVLLAGCALAVVSQAALVAHYTFDDSGALGIDFSGNGYHLNDIGDPSQNTTDQKLGTGALALDGDDAVGTSSGFPTASLSSYSFTLWFRVDSTAEGGTQAILSTRNSTANGFLLYLDGGDDIRLGSYDDGHSALQSGVIPANGTWTHVAATYDGATSVASLYVNGVLKASGVQDYTVSELDDFGIGSRYGHAMGDNLSAGDIDDVGIWDEALSLSDIQTVYTNGISDTNNWKYLEQKLIDWNIGGGICAVTAGEPGYDKYVAAVNAAVARANTALSNFDTYNIQTNAAGEVVDGAAWTGYSQTLVDELYGLGLAVHLNPGSESDRKAKLFVRWMQWHNEDLSHWYYAAVGRGGFLMKEALGEAEIEFLRGLLFPLIDKHINIMQNGLIDSTPGFRTADVMRTQAGGMFPAILLLPESTPTEQQTKQNYLDQAKELVDFALLPRSGVRGFLKPDGTGSHHYYNYASAYVPQGVQALSRIADQLKGSPWQLSDAELEPITRYVKELYFFAHYDHVPNGLSGRMFADGNMPEQSFNMVPLVAMAVTQPDADILQVAANLYFPGMSAFNYRPTYRLNQGGFPGDISAVSRTLQAIDQQTIQPAFIEGLRSYPYSPGMAVRKNNWKAFVKGINKWWWSYEGGITASNPEAYYGIYKSHGALEIRYYDPNDPGSATQNPLTRQGMDMSHRAGATTPIRTGADMINDAVGSRLRINSTSVGGVELGQEHGIFMLDLKNTPAEMKDSGFAARKSYFLLGDRIIMLGDGIKSTSANNYPVHTTLFQNFLNQNNRGSSPIYVNSGSAVTADTSSYTQTNLVSSHVLVDADGTGYYVPPNQHLQVERKNNGWRKTVRLNSSNALADRQVEALALPAETAYRSFAWLDHGVNPSGEGYEYVVLPGADYAATDSFRQKQDFGQVYKVLEKSSRAHVVHDLENDLWAYALYDDYVSTSNGPLRSIGISEVLPHADETVDAHPGYGVLIDASPTNQINLAVSFLDLRMHQAYNPTFSFSDRGTNLEKCDYASAPVELYIDLEGIWSVTNAPSELLDIEIFGTTTRLTVQCVDGASVNLTLELGYLDADSDGLPDEWEIEYFGSISNAVAGHADDPDQDGYDNLFEYGLGGNPTNGTDAGIMPVHKFTEANGTNWLEYVYRRRVYYALLGFYYQVEVSSNLVSGSWSTNGVSETGIQGLSAEFESVTNQVPMNGEQRFVRLKIEAD